MINRIVLVGRITKDAELRKTQTWKSVASFTVAVNRRGDGNTADFFRCSAWEKTAEYLAQYVHKGDLVGVQGRIEFETYKNKDGIEVKEAKVVCDSVDRLQAVERKEEPKQEPKEESHGYYPEQTEDFNTGPLLDIDSSELPF